MEIDFKYELEDLRNKTETVIEKERIKALEEIGTKVIQLCHGSAEQGYWNVLFDTKEFEEKYIRDIMSMVVDAGFNVTYNEGGWIDIEWKPYVKETV